MLEQLNVTNQDIQELTNENPLAREQLEKIVYRRLYREAMTQLQQLNGRTTEKETVDAEVG
jgi:hypothetical protein